MAQTDETVVTEPDSAPEPEAASAAATATATTTAETPAEPQRAPRRRRRRAWPWVLLVVVVLVVAAGGFLATRHRSSTSGLLTATVKTGTVSLTAQGSGTVVDAETISVLGDNSWVETATDGVAIGSASASAAVTVESVSVSLGQSVNSGDTLGTVKNARGDTVTLTAPKAGTIRAMNAVVNATANGALFQLGVGPMSVSVPISEYDIADVVANQAVTLDFNGLAVVGAGTVSSVVLPTTGSASTGTASSNTSSSSTVMDYPVLVAISNPPATLRPAMNVQVTVAIKEVANALSVPVQALHQTDSGAYTVTVLDTKTGKERTATVTVGLVGDSSVQITGGLTAGQKVVTGVASTSTTTGGTTSTGSPRSGL